MAIGVVGRLFYERSLTKLFYIAHRKILYFTIITLAAVVRVVPWALGVIGHDESFRVLSWCWIDPRLHSALFWQYFSGKAWEIASYITVVVLYARIKVALCKQV